tara:strand:+ start:4502 stop:4621 length:120 start_codon:yes stop_codon:yes gene_type:complete
MNSSRDQNWSPKKERIGLRQNSSRSTNSLEGIYAIFVGL